MASYAKTCIFLCVIAKTGWLPYVSDSQIAGTVGKSIFLQAIQIGMDGEDNYNLNGKVYVDGKGWQEYSNIRSDTVLGTTGQEKAIKAVSFEFNNFTGYKLQYQVHLSNKGCPQLRLRNHRGNIQILQKWK